MIKVELPEVIGIGAGATGDTLNGIAMMAEQMQSAGLTFKMQFASSTCLNDFCGMLRLNHGGQCDVWGDLVTIQGRG